MKQLITFGLGIFLGTQRGREKAMDLFEDLSGMLDTEIKKYIKPKEVKKEEVNENDSGNIQSCGLNESKP